MDITLGGLLISVSHTDDHSSPCPGQVDSISDYYPNSSDIIQHDAKIRRKSIRVDCSHSSVSGAQFVDHSEWSEVGHVILVIR